MTDEQFYHSARYKRWRKKVLERAGYLCEECKRYNRRDQNGEPIRATVAHHVKHRDEYPVEQAVKQKFDQVVGRPHIIRRNGRLYNYGLRSTGALRRAIGTTKPRQDRKGNYDIKIGFAKAREPETGIRCGYLAALIARGVKKRNQPPRPFIKPAENASKAASLEAFERKFDEEVNKL